MDEVRHPTHGGLRLDASASVSSNEFDAVIDKWKMAGEWAEQECNRLLGAPTNKPPALSGKELMTVSPNEYSEIYVRRLGWCNEVSRQQALARVRLGVQEMTEKELAQMIRHTNRSLSVAKTTEKELDEHVSLQPHHQHVEEQVMRCKWLKELLDQEYKESERNLQACSRQVEIRKEEFSGERRGGNIPENARRFVR